MNTSCKLSIALLLSLAACTASVEPASDSTQSNDQPASTALDQADRSCSVALLNLGLREVGTAGNYMTDCDFLSGPTCSDRLAWFGTVRVARKAIEAHAQVFVMFRSSDDPKTWKTVAASLARDNEYASQVFDFRFAALRKGANDGSQGIEMIPFLVYPDGTRIFDHNVVSDPSQSYHIGNSLTGATAGAWTYDNPEICRGTDPIGTIQFKSNWNISKTGKLVQRGDMKVSYDATRFSQCKTGAVETHVEGYFEPTGLSFGGTAPQRQSEFLFDVPAGATKAVLWFKVSCGDFSSYDSDFGRNFAFTIAAH